MLGVPIAAGGGFNDGLNVLNILANHPSCARFISKKLLRWLLNYDPSPALVADIAGEFTRTGGDIKASFGASCTTTTSSGRRRSSSGRSTTSYRHCG